MSELYAIPPIVTVTVEGGLDIMVANDAARRLADLVGFSPAYQALAAGAVHALSDLVLKTHQNHTIQINGVEDSDARKGLQISCEVEWLAQAPTEMVLDGLQKKLDGLVDDIQFSRETPPTIYLTVWLTDARRHIRAHHSKNG